MESRRCRWESFLRDLLFTWLCISSSSVIARNIERYDTAYECEGKALRIECREGELIHLIRANYGRFSITICNEHGNTDWSVNCMSPKSFRVLYNKCNQQQNCSIMAATTQFGDPCPNTLKYLEAHYQCMSSATTTTLRPSPPWLLTTNFPLWNTDSHTSNLVTSSLITTSTTDAASPTTDFLVDSSVRGATSIGSRSYEEYTRNVSFSKPLKTPSLVDALQGMISAKSQSPALQAQSFFTTTIDPFKTSRKTSAGISPEEINVFCPAQIARKLIWNATRLGEMVVQNCPGGASGFARWHCVQVSSHAFWERGTPDLSECHSVWLSSLEKRVHEGEIILSISSDLSQVTNNSRELYGGDMLITTKILKNMAEKMAQDVRTYQDPRQREVSVAELLQGAVTTGSNLLDEAQSESWKDLSHQDQMVAATSLLVGLQENAFLLADTLNYEKMLVHERRNILLEVRVLKARNLERELEIFPKAPIHGSTWERLQDRVELTRSSLLKNANDDGFVRLVFIAFDRLEEILQPPSIGLFLSVNEDRGLRLLSSLLFLMKSHRATNITQILNSKVISASLGKGRHVQLSQEVGVRLSFQHIIFENVTNARCVFWDYKTSAWSEEGCITIESNKTHTVCECSHLTNFAVLMDIHTPKISMEHQRVQIITYIGCAISIICLILGIIIVQLFRRLKVRTQSRKFIERHSWLPNCFRYSKDSTSDASGTSTRGTDINGGKGAIISHNTSNFSDQVMNSSILSLHANANVGTVAAFQTIDPTSIYNATATNNTNFSINVHLRSLPMSSPRPFQSFGAQQMHMIAHSNHNRHTPSPQGDSHEERDDSLN